MKNAPIPVQILCTQVIANADSSLLHELGVPDGHRSLGILTTDCDDVSYAALDEATKKAAVSVVYARSMYAGASNASTGLCGEFIGILSAANPEEITSGLSAACSFISHDACFYSANDDDSVVYFAHCISRSGSYLSKAAGILEGEAIAYLIAPPAEAIVALDAAMKAADVRMCLFYGPPTETNFAGGLLTGTQAACKAACEAFAQSVCRVAAQPLRI